MSIRDRIRQAAQETAARIQERLSDIERRLAEAKEQVAKIRVERDAARLAPRRLNGHANAAYPTILERPLATICLFTERFRECPLNTKWTFGIRH
jgi:F0F1-type ATP synthase membrane subunit b/b'